MGIQWGNITMSDEMKTVYTAIFAYAILMDVELMSDTEYGECLDVLFMNTPDDDLLLELEWCSSDIRKSIKMIYDYCTALPPDYSVVGRILTNRAKRFYYKDGMTLNSFCEKMYSLWKMLPSDIQGDDPFHILCYAGDPLGWGDIEQTRELCEKFFNYYSNTEE